MVSGIDGGLPFRGKGLAGGFWLIPLPKPFAERLKLFPQLFQIHPQGLEGSLRERPVTPVLIFAYPNLGSLSPYLVRHLLDHATFKSRPKRPKFSRNFSHTNLPALFKT